MNPIAIIGVFGEGADFTTGQAVKCMEISRWLRGRCGDDNVVLVNTHNWKKHPVRLFSEAIHAFRTCGCVIMLPAQNGLKVFAPMACLLGRVFRKPVHYIVIGGWLPDLVKKNVLMRRYVRSCAGVYVETRSMAERLKECGIANSIHMPNCRALPDFLPARREWMGEKRAVCTYSRVTEEKGIADAAEIVRRANVLLGRNIFELHIYGKVAPEYRQTLKQLLAEYRDTASYCGVKNADEGIETLSGYFALLFPTYYHGEGFAGTVLDAFAARTPVIANDWKYNSEVITSGVDGFLYPFRDLDCAARQLVRLYREPDTYRAIQNGCRESAARYSADHVMEQFLTNLQQAEETLWKK